MHKTYRIGGMDCAHCAETIEKGVSRLPGVMPSVLEFLDASADRS